jgi:hypothetical protein
VITFPLLGASAAPTVWVVPSLARVGPHDAPGHRLNAQLFAARGEYESFQVIVRAPVENSLTHLSLTVTDLTNSAGAVISHKALALFREQYVWVSPSSPNWGGSNQPLAPGWYPDGLIPFVDPDTGQTPPSSAVLRAEPCSVGAGVNQPFWVDVLVPRTAAVGQYKGSFTVISDEGSASGEIDLKVWNFTLPVSPTLKSAFVYFSAGTLAAEKELLRNKVAPLHVDRADEAELISDYGLSTNNLGFFSGADVSHCSMSPPPSVSQIRTVTDAHSRQLVLLDYLADEVGACPNLFPEIKQWAAALHQAGVKSMITMAPVPDLLDDGLGTGQSAADIWVVLPEMYDKAASVVARALAKGDEVWSYNTLVQDAYSPKWEIDFASINFRIQPGFISQSLNLTGLLYWRVDMWPADPWHNVNNSGTFSSNNYPGEGMLVYPGEPVGIRGVSPSMRLKWIRDGVEDYEYVALLKKAGLGDWALQIVRSVAPDWTHWTRDPRALESARHALGQKLDSLAPDDDPRAGVSKTSIKKSLHKRRDHLPCAITYFTERRLDWSSKGL